MNEQNNQQPMMDQNAMYQQQMYYQQQYTYQQQYQQPAKKEPVMPNDEKITKQIDLQIKFAKILGIIGCTAIFIYVFVETVYSIAYYNEFALEHIINTLSAAAIGLAILAVIYFILISQAMILFKVTQIKSCECGSNCNCGCGSKCNCGCGCNENNKCECGCGCGEEHKCDENCDCEEHKEKKKTKKTTKK